MFSIYLNFSEIWFISLNSGLWFVHCAVEENNQNRLLWMPRILGSTRYFEFWILGFVFTGNWENKCSTPKKMKMWIRRWRKFNVFFSCFCWPVFLLQVVLLIDVLLFLSSCCIRKRELERLVKILCCLGFWILCFWYDVSIYCGNIKCFMMIRLVGILKMLLGTGINIRTLFLLYEKGKWLFRLAAFSRLEA